MRSLTLILLIGLSLSLKFSDFHHFFERNLIKERKEQAKFNQNEEQIEERHQPEPERDEEEERHPRRHHHHDRRPPRPHRNDTRPDRNETRPPRPHRHDEHRGNDRRE